MPSSQHALMEATKKRAAKLGAKGAAVDFGQLLRMEPDSGTTNIPNVKSKHWTRWLATQNRCVVPFNSFSEFNKGEGGDIWFALDETRPLACFAGIWTNWTSVRKVKEGETTNVLYAFLTTEPNAEVGAIHPKAMPVILTTPDEVETWMSASPDEALKLQRPLPDGRSGSSPAASRKTRPGRKFEDQRGGWRPAPPLHALRRRGLNSYANRHSINTNNTACAITSAHARGLAFGLFVSARQPT
jgi:putative SOS response-associated peptidase YedK